MSAANVATETDKLITANNAADLFGVSLSTFWKLVNSGVAPPRIKLGSQSVRFSMADVRGSIERLKAMAAAA